MAAAGSLDPGIAGHRVAAGQLFVVSARWAPPGRLALPRRRGRSAGVDGRHRVGRAPACPATRCRRSPRSARTTMSSVPLPLKSPDPGRRCWSPSGRPRRTAPWSGSCTTQVSAAAGGVPEQVVGAVAVEVAGEGLVRAVHRGGVVGVGAPAQGRVPDEVVGAPLGVPEHVGAAVAVEVTDQRRVGAVDRGGDGGERAVGVAVPVVVDRAAGAYQSRSSTSSPSKSPTSGSYVPLMVRGCETQLSPSHSHASRRAARGVPEDLGAAVAVEVARPRGGTGRSPSTARGACRRSPGRTTARRRWTRGCR